MTLQKLIELHNQNANIDLVIKKIKGKREAAAFRLYDLKEAYRHVGDIIKIFEEIEEVTKRFNLKPLNKPDFDDLHVFFKVR